MTSLENVISDMTISKKCVESMNDRKGVQFVSGASREHTYIYIVVKCYCVIRPANT